MRSFDADVFKSVLWLTPEQAAQPLGVVEDFFQHYHLFELREILWELAFTALASDGDAVDEGRKRANLLFFYQKMETFLEAVHLLWQWDKKKSA